MKGSTLVAAILAFSTTTNCQTNCSTFNTTKGPFPYGWGDTTQHTTGDHSWANSMTGTCTYTGSAQETLPSPCDPYAAATSSSGASDNGITVPYWHTPGAHDANGSASGALGAAVTADAEGAAAVVSCGVIPCGSPIITISGPGTGIGFSVTYGTPNTIWTAQQYYANTCTAETLPSETSGGGGKPGCVVLQAPPTQTSPVVIDTTGKGFHFTNPAKGDYVSFDIKGDGTLVKLSWPEHGSGNAWLVLDRDGDGLIKDGKELFGNYTPHSSPPNYPNYPNPNGFVALDWYDQPAQGGDMNLILDKRDAIWPRLKLWIDDHCYKTPDLPCVSQPYELHTLESLGVNSISLVWDGARKTDAVGNVFRFKTMLNPDAETTPVDDKGQRCCDLHQTSHDGRLAYDVFLQSVN